MKFIILNCITNRWNLYIYVTLRSNEYEHPENDMIMSKLVEAW